MNHEPLVSVIITTYHNEVYLPRAIESIRHQTYKNIELIVVDDNPPGTPERAKTEAVMGAYPDVIYLKHPENRNGAAARNTGIRAATGDYIAFLDNDDFYFSDHIESCVKALHEHPDCTAVVCGVVKICGGLCWDLIPAAEGDLARELLFRETALGTGSNLFVKTDAVRAINGFDERFRRHQDVEFGLRYFANNKVCSLPQVRIVKEMDGFSNAPNFQRFRETKQLLWDTFSDTIHSLTPDEQKRYYAGQYSALLYAACKTGDRSHMDWTLEQLTRYRQLGRKEKLLVTLSRLKLFDAYECLKKAIKTKKSPHIQADVTRHLSEYDREIFDRALKRGDLS